MSTITIFGVTGYTGAAIADELLTRGHRVVGVARDVSGVPERDGLTTISGTIDDEQFVERALEGADVAISAVPALAASLLDALPGLLAAAEKTGARIGIMGGAGSLNVSEGGPLLFDTSGFPDEFKPEAQAAADVLETLRTSDTAVDWFYVSPAAGYGSYAPGERTGVFRVGGDVLLADEAGQSALSAPDLAIAFADEIEHPAHHRERFTVAY